MSEIHQAVIDNKPLTLEALLEKDPKLAVAKDQDGRTPIHWAVSFDRPELLDMLLKATKVDLDDLQDDSGWTPVHISASIDDLDMFKKLVEREPRPDIDNRTGTGQTCLHYAVSKGYNDMVDYLINECHASARIKDKKKQYALHRAAATGSMRLASILIKAKSPLNGQDIYGFTPLHEALSEGHGDLAIYLVKAGADPNIEDLDGQTPAAVALNDKVRKFYEASLAQMS